MTQQQIILDFLKQGKHIRLSDGWVFAAIYVDRKALRNLVDQGVVTKFEKGGTDYVKAKVTK